MPEIFKCNLNKTIVENLMNMKVLAKMEKHMHPITYTYFILNNHKKYKLYFNSLTHKYLLLEIETPIDSDIIKFKNCSID